MKKTQIYLFNIISLIARSTIPLLPTFHIARIGDTGITSLVGHKYVSQSIYSLTSFYYQSKRLIPCTIIDDGTLTSSDIEAMKKHFVGIHIVSKKQANRRVHVLLKKYTSILKFRNNQDIHKLYIKLTDATLLPKYNKILYMDVDILFINTPIRLVRWIDTDEQTYLYEPEYRSPEWGIGDGWNFAGNALRHALNISFEERFNSGLLCLDKSLLPLHFINRVVAYMHKVQMDKTWPAEQYALAAAFAQVHAQTFGRKYKHLAYPDVFVLNNISSYDCVHFAYEAKPYFYKEALKLFVKTNHFKSS